MARARGGQIYSPDIVEELKNAMSVESRPGQDDEASFRRKVTALQRFLNHGISRFSIDGWNHALTALCYALHHHHHQDDPHHHHHHHPHLQQHVLTRLSGLDDLRALSRGVMLRREGGSLREADAQALRELDNFLLALSCVREAKDCCGRPAPLLVQILLRPGLRLGTGTLQRAVRQSHQQGRDPGRHGGPQLLRGIRQAVRHPDAAADERQHGPQVRRTVADMQQILARWDRLMTAEGQIPQEDLDAESHQDLQMLSETGAAFEPVLRLLPDIFAKFYKCLELLKQWWVLAHEIYPELPINRPTTAPTPTRDAFEDLREEDSSRQGSESELSTLNGTSPSQTSEGKVPVSEQLQNIEESIQVKEDSLHSLHNELELLEERERHFESLAEAYEKVTAELEEQTRQRKELVTVREKETFPPHNQMLDARAAEILSVPRPHNHTHDLNEQVARAERAIQMLQFQQSLLRQDYMVQLEVRPSLIRFADDLRIKIADAESNLVEDKMERIKLQTMAEEEEEETTTASGRSVSPSDPDRSSDKREDTPPKTDTDLHKAAERKLELSRLLTRPMREDTSGSSVMADITVVPATERKRRLSHPVTRKEETHKRADVPVIKIHHVNHEKPSTSASNSQSSKKSPRGPPVPPTTSVVKSQSLQRKISVPDTQSRTEPLFQRRVVKVPENEESVDRASERRTKQSDQPVQRPRARSDPHTSKTDAKASKLKPEPSRHLIKTNDAEKPEAKAHPSVRDKSPYYGPPKADPNDKQDGQAMPKKARPVGPRKTSTTTSSDDAGKIVVRSHSSGSDDTTRSKTIDAKRSKEATKRLSTASFSSNTTEGRKLSNGTTPSSRPDDYEKKDRDKQLLKSTARHADKGVLGTQPKPKEKDDVQKYHTTSPQTMVHTPGKATSQKKPAQDDIRKGSNGMTSQDLKHVDKKVSKTTIHDRQKGHRRDDKDDVESNRKLDDVREGEKVTSQKAKTTRRPNGVISNK
ncbi:LOW QUALITY PROTEIN: uncharacterized protein LOC143294333 [Babylonia areolata]|uniref:LOW QUALITY PROTEIN: uncharacterized protein LOC143294333 n=1 Tax=Babylonia areolata TaxID=304850 RepID=UPI003FD3D47A